MNSSVDYVFPFSIAFLLISLVSFAYSIASQCNRKREGAFFFILLITIKFTVPFKSRGMD